LPILLGINIDYAFHTFAPDLYYLSGSFSAIFLVLILKKKMILIVKKSKFIEYFLGFFHRHTLSIFLLHSFSIYLAENYGGLVHPQEKIVIYGFFKLIIVLIVTCVLAVPFTIISAKISRFVLRDNRRIV
jgi:hypothetical protein